jgi:hypothetical protein
MTKRLAMLALQASFFEATAGVLFEHGPMIVHVSLPKQREDGRYVVTHEPTGTAVWRTNSLVIAKRVATVLGDDREARDLAVAQASKP